MTSDEFNSQYKLLNQMAVKEGRSYTAEHRASGRAVLVHVLDETQLGGISNLDAMLERLEPRDRSRVLATMTIDHSLVVITQFLQGFEGFEPWLRGKAEAPAAPLPPQAGPPDEQHGEFTRLFRAGKTPVPPPDRPSPPANLPPVPPVASNSNFTDLFRAAAGPPAGSPRPDSATIPPVRLAGVRLPPPEPATPESGPPRLVPNFESGPEPATPEPGPPRLVPNFETGPGPATPEPGPPRLVPNFETGGEPAAPASLAGWPRADEVIIRGGDQPVAPLAPSSWEEGPSEYTRLLGTAGSAFPPIGELAQAAEATEQREEPEGSKRSYIPLFVVLNLVFILATGLVVYFALRRC